MKRFFGAFVVTTLLAGPGSPTFADEKELASILDKSIKALGGAERLAKASTASWKGKGMITFGMNESEIKFKAVAQGLDHLRSEFDMEFNGTPLKGVTVLSGTKGWRKFGEEVQDLDDDAIAAEKQRSSLNSVGMVLPLKGKEFKLESAPEEKVAGKAADVIKGTGPDGKAFRLFLDKESGLPVRLTATVRGFQGEEYVQDTTYGDYKEFDGIKRPSKTESKRDGEPFLKMELTEFKVVEKLEAGCFDEPK